MAGAKIALSSTSGELKTDGNDNAMVNLPKTLAQAGFAVSAMQNDAGTVIGTPYLLSPEVDADFRQRVAHENMLDFEAFNYTAQNTGKHAYANTTMTITWNTSGLLTNATSITTTTTGVTFSSYAMWSLIPSGALYCEAEGSISAQPVANTLVDFGLFHKNAANPYNPTDGASFRLTSAGLFGVISHNGTETTTAAFTFTYTNNRVYKFIAAVYQNRVEFWIDNVLYGTIVTPVGQGQPFMAAAVPFSLRHAIAGGAAGGVLQFTLRDYVVSLGGPAVADSLGVMNNRVVGSYQGLSGGTMGSLANYANSANPAAAVPTNTTAALGTGLGGQFWETASLALTTDGIICSYQVPAGTVSVPGKRLKVVGIGLTSYIQTVIVGGPFVSQWSLAFGHTAVSLATAEGIAATAPRRIALAPFTQLVTTAQAISTIVSQPGGSWVDLTNAEVYINPGEFIAMVTKHVGTVGTSGTIAHVITFAFSWE